jgi:hypothetical protein
MRTDTGEKVLEKLATSDKATIVIERQSDGKMRVTSGSWDREKVILHDQVLEVRRSSTPGCRGPQGASLASETPPVAAYDPTGRAPNELIDDRERDRSLVRR